MLLNLETYISIYMKRFLSEREKRPKIRVVGFSVAFLEGKAERDSGIYQPDQAVSHTSSARLIDTDLRAEEQRTRQRRGGGKIFVSVRFLQWKSKLFSCRDLDEVRGLWRKEKFVTKQIFTLHTHLILKEPHHSHLTSTAINLQSWKFLVKSLMRRSLSLSFSLPPPSSPNNDGEGDSVTISSRLSSALAGRWRRNKE